MSRFELQQDFLHNNRDLASQILEAAEELFVFSLPTSVYDLTNHTGDANAAIRKHLSTDLVATYFSTLLSETERAANGVQEWLQTNDIADTSHIKTKLQFQRISAEQALLQRVLFEGLISIINFSELKSVTAELYIRHYVACRMYENLRKIRNEYNSLYDFSGSSAKPLVQEKLDRIVDELIAMESDAAFDCTNCWYLTLPKGIFTPLNSVKGSSYPKYPNPLKDASMLLSDVLQRGQTAGLDNMEKVALGLTYQTLYGETSRDIHFMPDFEDDFFLTPVRFQQSVIITNLLAALTVVRCLSMHTVANPRVSPATKLFERLSASSKQPIYESVVGNPQGREGDFVAASVESNFIFGTIAKVNVHQSTNFVLYEIEPVYDRHQKVLTRGQEVLAIFEQSCCDKIADRYRAFKGGFVASTSLTFRTAIASNDYQKLVEIAQELGCVTHGAATLRFYVGE